MSAIKLPPLPEPSIRRTRPDGKRLEWYSADQLRARDLAVAAAVIEACAAVCDNEWDGDADTYEASVAYNECADAIRAINLEEPK